MYLTSSPNGPQVAAAIRHLGARVPVDLVVTGMASLDGMTSMLPAALSAELDLAQLTLAAEVTIVEAVVRIGRELDSATEVLTARPRALVSVSDQANEPRYPSLQGIMAARKKSGGGATVPFAASAVPQLLRARRR